MGSELHILIKFKQNCKSGQQGLTGWNMPNGPGIKHDQTGSNRVKGGQTKSNKVKQDQIGENSVKQWQGSNSVKWG